MEFSIRRRINRGISLQPSFWQLLAKSDVPKTLLLTAWENNFNENQIDHN
jgi:hypothetical protein